MKMCAIQLDVVLGDRAANMANAETQIALAMAASPDVLVLPELWDVGFYPANVVELGDEDGKEARAFFSAQAKGHKVNIVGGSIVRGNGGKIWNTTYVYDRRGELVVQYDKIHLFSPSGEHTVFQAGDSLAVYELDGERVGSVTCYDMRFCELVRSVALAGVKVLFAPAAWPHPRLNHWRVLAMARAIENQFYVVAVNTSGKSDSLTFCGHSIMVDPLGEIIAEAGEGGQILTGECDLSVIDDIRSRINVFRDRRPEVYRLDASLAAK